MGHVFEMCFVICHKCDVAHGHGHVFDGKLGNKLKCVIPCGLVA